MVLGLVGGQLNRPKPNASFSLPESSVKKKAESCEATYRSRREIQKTDHKFLRSGRGLSVGFTLTPVVSAPILCRIGLDCIPRSIQLSIPTQINVTERRS